MERLLFNVQNAIDVVFLLFWPRFVVHNTICHSTQGIYEKQYLSFPFSSVCTICWIWDEDSLRGLVNDFLFMVEGRETDSVLGCLDRDAGVESALVLCLGATNPLFRALTLADGCSG